jgi:hypothetical protein
MTLPALPKELGNPTLDIHSLFIYLQRIKDQFTESVTNTVFENTFSAEDAQDAIGQILQATATITPTYNDAVPFLQWTVIPNTSIQQVEVAENGTVAATTKTLNFVEQEHNQFTIAPDFANDKVDISINPFTCRYVASGETATLLNQQCLISARYFNVQGKLALQGDATLQVI